MNGFTKKSIGTLTLGEKLKKLRSDKRISLSEVSKLTRIQVSYLEFLENGEYEKLPADVYVKGFLRSYADFLGVDERILLKLYNKEKGIRNNLEKKRNPKKKKKKPLSISSFVFTPKKIVLTTVSLVVIIGLIFLFSEINSFAGEPSLVVISPESDSEVSKETISVEGVTDKDVVLFINGQSVLVGDEGNFKEDVALKSGINNINIKAVNKFQKEAQKELVVKLNAGEAVYNKEINQREEEQLKPEEFKISLRVDPGPVWLNVEADGNLVFSGTMLSGAMQMFKAKDKIVVSCGKGNATFVSFNGEEIGALSDNSDPIRNFEFKKDFQKKDLKIEKKE